MNEAKIKRALVSVSDKSGVTALAKALHERGIEIISTGGTLEKMKEAGIPAVSVRSFTGSPEVMDGRVKTLHPKIHAGILFRRDNEEDCEQLAQLESKGIDLVVVNLYPFEKTVARPDVTESDAIENIDIGGPSMLRSAAKNFNHVTVVVDPADYDTLLQEIEEHDGMTSLEFRRRCATKAFSLTARYDTAISTYFNSSGTETSATGSRFPAVLAQTWQFRSSLRYGENPHQDAAVFVQAGYTGPTLLDAEILSGKELSFNNYNDLNACLDLLLEFTEPFACVLKHANPCGAAVSKNIAEAYKAAYESDPLSAFGSIIGVNKTVDLDCANHLHETHFVECIIAPDFAPDALKLLQKKKTRRLLRLPAIARGRLKGDTAFKHILGGLLVQSADDAEISVNDLKVVTKRAPTQREINDMLFAWKVVKHTKSNAIVLAKNGATVGIGMGQTSRVDAGFLAVKRAGERAKGSVMASDAFYPMPDGVEVGTDAGVTAIIQPGGSKGDDDAVAAADKAGAAMVFTGIRHFKH
ncbi:MAG: bifunctional phosphoribosylaminoimidazolecarboxamide formyltransferase/IMP cyclohydrolase [candidate division Zixibacteria bacterium]|jgi:phosphoribosylaminoimidazolecarboxamide formyltransferase/IMP cyclohydrolase|nr:bifunctional phosphoribosylaminoimidazolecarboxamide formyltransferase/IMP cyclohydrolase [candidate division Zixibacteria bacterium]